MEVVTAATMIGPDSNDHRNLQTVAPSMKRKECSADYPEPDGVDGTAWFVCAKCGSVHEVVGFRGYSPEERITGERGQRDDLF